MTSPSESTPRILLIDDERDFRDYWEATVARTSDEGIAALATGPWDELWLDFVLLRGDDTTHVADWLRKQHDAGNHVEIGRIIVHSSAIGAYGLLNHILSPLGYNVENEWDTNLIFEKR